VGFRACESSRQGATATPTTALLSSCRRPTSTAGAKGACPMVVREADTGGRVFCFLPSYHSQPIPLPQVNRPRLGSFRHQGDLPAPWGPLPNPMGKTGLVPTAIHRSGMCVSIESSDRVFFIVVIGFLTLHCIIIIRARAPTASDRVAYSSRTLSPICLHSPTQAPCHRPAQTINTSSPLLYNLIKIEQGTISPQIRYFPDLKPAIPRML
jgi:hypothetical protein